MWTQSEKKTATHLGSLIGLQTLCQTSETTLGSAFIGYRIWHDLYIILGKKQLCSYRLAKAPFVFPHIVLLHNTYLACKSRPLHFTHIVIFFLQRNSSCRISCWWGVKEAKHNCCQATDPVIQQKIDPLCHRNIEQTAEDFWDLWPTCLLSLQQQWQMDLRSSISSAWHLFADSDRHALISMVASYCHFDGEVYSNFPSKVAIVTLLQN